MHPKKAGKVTSELLVSVAVVALPALAGVVVNSILGWWPGLAAFLVVATVVGRAAYLVDRREKKR